MLSARGPAPLGPRVVFVSYSREDADWLSRLATMLKPLVRNRYLELWIDRDIQTGRRWRAEVASAISRADAALLLVSPDFLASDFIMEQELPALIGRGVPLAPVLLKACLYGDEPRLADVQWAHDPRRDGPLDGAANVEGAIVQVCGGLRSLLDSRSRSREREWDGPPQTGGQGPVDLAARPAGGRDPSDADDPVLPSGGRDPSTRPPRRTGGKGESGFDDGSSRGRARTPALAVGDTAARLHGVPDLPAGFVARDELASLRDALLGAGQRTLAITGGRALGLHGQGGIGKTVLAAALARDPLVRASFPDGVFWVTVGEHPDLLAGQLALLQALGDLEDDAPRSADTRQQLRAALVRRRCLIVVDDVWSAAAASAFDVIGRSGRVLYTTRDLRALREVGGAARQIDVLSAPSARELLAGAAGTAGGLLPDEPVQRVLDATGRVALALALVGAAVGRGRCSWAQAADALERAGSTFLDHPYAKTFTAITIAVDALDPGLRDLHRSLVTFPEDTRIPAAAVARLWSRRGVTSDGAGEQLQRLADAKLLTLEHDSFWLHDLQREFLLLHTDSVRLAHHELLEAYRSLLPAPDRPWRELPPDEPYIWEHLIEHLGAAGERAAVTRVATDLGYVCVCAARHGLHAAANGVRLAAALDPQDEAIGWVLGLLTRHRDLLTGHERIEDLAATLLSRTATAPAGVDWRALHPLLPRLAIAPVWGLPDPLVEGRSASAVVGGTVCAVPHLAFAPDGGTLASAAQDGSVRLWDVATGSQTAPLEGPHVGMLELAFLPDGRAFATAGTDGSVRLWDVATGSHVTVGEGDRGPVSAVTFSPDGRTFASASHDGPLRLWDMASGSEIASVKRDGNVVFAIAFAPDGRAIAIGGERAFVASLRLWDVASGSQTAVHGGRAGLARTVVFSADGCALGTADGDRTLRVWDVASSAQTSVMRGHRRSVSGVAFSPDGGVLASASFDGTVRLWDARDGEPIVCVQLGTPLFALAVSDRGLAVGLHHGVAYFRWLRRSPPPAMPRSPR